MRFGSLRPAGLVLTVLLGASTPTAVAAQGAGAWHAPPSDASSTLDAEASELSEAPPRYVVAASLGAPMRLTRRDDFDQGLVAPLFADILAGYVFSSARRWRHGVGLGLSVNLTADGGYTEPVDPGEQLVVMPSYLLHASLDEAWLLLGHVGVPILAGGGRSLGLEVGAGLGYRWLAGAGAYAEAGANGFTGGDSTLHVTASLEIGVFVDYEVLP